MVWFIHHYYELLMVKKNNQVRLSVKVITKAKTNQIIGWQGEFLKIQLTAAPVKGQANEKLISLLSEFLNLSKQQIVIVRGFITNKKIISLPVDGLKTLKKKFI
jgi:uncharacterized protein (TIGR00251 family)